MEDTNTNNPGSETNTHMTLGSNTEEEVFQKIDDALIECRKALTRATSKEAIREIANANMQDTAAQAKEWWATTTELDNLTDKLN